MIRAQLDLPIYRGKRKMQVLFRAKEKNSNNYVIGYEYYNHVEDEYYITHYTSGNNYKVDRTTRSINIEDMIDSQGNAIFASLQVDGKGGDIANYNNQGNWIAIYIENAFMWVNVLDMQKIGTKQPVSFLRLKPLAKMIVTGIQE